MTRAHLAEPSPNTAPAPRPQVMTLDAACGTIFNLGATHHRDGRLPEAETAYRAVLQVRPDHADSLHLLGVAAYQQGRNEEAITLIGQALRINERRADYASNLGNALQRAVRLDDAESCYRAAIAIDAQNATAHNNLGAVLHELGRSQEALVHCREALRLRPSYLDAHNNLCIALANVGAFEAAAESGLAALRLDPNRVETHNNLGIVLACLRRFDDALGHYAAALAIRPDAAEVHHNLSMTLLRVGRFEEGWREYEWRWRTRQLGPSRRDFNQPLWDGSPLGGRTLLAHAEQGFGDTLQFCRHLSGIEGRVVVEVPPALVRLLRGQLGDCQVIGRGEALPDFDVHCPMLSLPGRTEPSPDPTTQGQPYLKADPAAIACWEARLGQVPGPRIGLVWAGGARPDQPTLAAINGRRSMTLATLAPLASVAGMTFVSLQKGLPALEAANPPAEMVLYDFTAELDDFADTAALIQTLDLVIGVDTAVIHLAGALGKPVWLLNRFDSCWRWLTDRDDSPWYPSLKQLRQPAPGDWTSVVWRAALALSETFSSAPIR